MMGNDLFLAISYFQVLSVPFVLTDDRVGSIAPDVAGWLGEVDSRLTAQWVDLFITMVNK